MTADIEKTILDLLAPLAPGKSLAPEDVARALDPEGWRRLLPQVRATARGMARQYRVVITRHGKPADPEAFKGVYRLRAAGDPPAENADITPAASFETPASPAPQDD
jgi:hypothetical protein